MSTPEATDAEDHTRRSGRRAVGAVGTVAVVAGLVLIGFGFGDWGPSKLGLTPPDHPTGRLAAAVALGVVALLFTLLAGARGRFGPLNAAVAVAFTALTAVVAWWLAAALSPYAWPTHAGVAAATGAALVAWGVFAATVGRLVVDRTRRSTRSGVAVAVAVAVLAGAGCVPLLVFDVSPSVQVASSAGSYQPPAQLPTTPSWTTPYDVLGSDRKTVVLAHDADDRCIVQGVDPATGRGRWQWSAPIGGCDDAPTDAVLTAAGVVAVPAVDREYVLDADTGRPLWSHGIAADDERDLTATEMSLSTVAASSTTALLRAITGDGLRFTLVDLRTGHVLRTLESRQVCPDIEDLGDVAGRVALSGQTAAVLLTCADNSAHLVVAPATGDVTVVDAASPAGIAIAADTIVLADRPAATTARVRGLPLSGSTPRWTQTWETTDPSTSPGYVAPLTAGAVVVATDRVGTTGVVRVDAATGALSAFLPPGQEQSAIPIGCTTTTCWYRSDDDTAVVGLDGERVPLHDAGSAVIGPAVISEQTGLHATAVYS